MKHRVKVKVPVEKRGLFGIKKTVMETRIVELDGKTYKELKKEWERRPYSVEEMMFYDDIFDER
jgi:predicted transcriptional regulator